MTKLSEPQQRLLTRVRRKGVVTEKAQARRTIEALANAGLVEYEVEVVEWEDGSETDEYTVRLVEEAAPKKKAAPKKTAAPKKAAPKSGTVDVYELIVGDVIDGGAEVKRIVPRPDGRVFVRTNKGDRVFDADAQVGLEQG